MKLDACRKWCLTKCWRDWHKLSRFNKLLLSGLTEFFMHWQNEMFRVQFVRRSIMNKNMRFIRPLFKRWHNALYRMQSVIATRMRCGFWHCLINRQKKALTIVFHLWLRHVSSVTKLCILMQVGSDLQSLELSKTFFELWLQAVHNQICDCIRNARILFCTDVLDCFSFDQ